MLLVANKRALHDYTIERKVVAGVVLTGPEVKSLRLKHASLQGSFVKIVGNQLVLINAMINPYRYAWQEGYDPKKSRVLLVKRAELERLRGEVSQTGRTLVPLQIMVEHRRIKVVVGVGRGKKLHEKREVSKKRDERRQVDAEYKSRMKGF